MNHFGRATFLPLTNVKSKRGFDRKDALKEEGVIGIASDLVTCDELYEEPVSLMINRSVVFPSNLAVGSTTNVTLPPDGVNLTAFPRILIIT